MLLCVFRSADRYENRAPYEDNSAGCTKRSRGQVTVYVSTRGVPRSVLVKREESSCFPIDWERELVKTPPPSEGNNGRIGPEGRRKRRHDKAGSC